MGVVRAATGAVRAAAVTAAAATLLVAGCSPTTPTPAGGGEGVPRPPPLPISTQSGGGLPIVWVGGTLGDVSSERLEIHEDSGSLVTVERLGAGATAFFGLSAGGWTQLEGAAQVAVGGEVCIQSAMTGGKLLALRVFLGATCGPD